MELLQWNCGKESLGFLAAESPSRYDRCSVNFRNAIPIKKQSPKEALGDCSFYEIKSRVIFLPTVKRILVPATKVQDWDSA